MYCGSKNKQTSVRQRKLSMYYYRRRQRARLPYATDQTSGMFQADNRFYDNGLAGAEYSCYTGHGYYSFSDSELDGLPGNETYQYNNPGGHDIANGPEPQHSRPQIDYPSTEEMYSEREEWRPPFADRRNCNWEPRRRSHLDDIYYPNYETDTDSADNRASCSGDRLNRRYQNYPPRGVSILHKLSKTVLQKRPKKRKRMFSVNLKSNTVVAKLVDKQPSAKNNSPTNDKQSLQVKSVPCTSKSSEISSKEADTTSLEDSHQKVEEDATKSGVDVKDNDDSNVEEQLASATYISTNNCSSDEDKSCLLSNGFVDSRVLELNIDLSMNENTVSPKRRKLNNINFNEILSSLSGILQEDSLSNSKTVASGISNTMSGDDLLELLQSSPSCSTNNLTEERDTNSRKMSLKSLAKSVEESKDIDKPKEKDKVCESEIKASEKNPYFPTLANYSIPKLGTRKNKFSDTNELYLNRMHTLFGSDYSDIESSDEIVPKTTKMIDIPKDRPESSKAKPSSSSIEKCKSNHKPNVDRKLPNKCSVELKKIDKRRHSLDTTRSLKQQSELRDTKAKLLDRKSTGKNEDERFPTKKNEGRKISNLQQDLSKAKLADKFPMGKNGNRRTPNVQECDSNGPHQRKLMDKFSTRKNNDQRAPKFPKSQLTTSGKVKSVDNKDRRSSNIQKSEVKDSKHAKLVEKQSSAKNDDRSSNKKTESEVKVPNQAKLVGRNEDLHLPNIQETELEGTKQATSSDKHSTGKDPIDSKHSAQHIENGGISKVQEVPNQRKVEGKHCTRQNEDRISSKIPESGVKDVKLANLVDKNCTNMVKKPVTRCVEDIEQQSKLGVSNQAKLVDTSELKEARQLNLVDGYSAEQSEGRGSSQKTQESEQKSLKLAGKDVGRSELKNANHAKSVDKHPTEYIEDKTTPVIQESRCKVPNQVELQEEAYMKLLENPSIGPNDNRKLPELQELELKAQTHGRVVDNHSANIQESKSKASKQVKLVDKHSAVHGEGGSSSKILESELKTLVPPKLVFELVTGPNENRKSSKVQESELKTLPAQSKLAAINSTGQVAAGRLHNMPESETKDERQSELTDNRSTRKNAKIPESEEVDKHSMEPKNDGRSLKVQESETKASSQPHLVHKHSKNEDKNTPKFTELKASDKAKISHHSTGKNQDVSTKHKIINSQEKIAQTKSNKRRRSFAEDTTSSKKLYLTKEPISKKITDIADTDTKQDKKEKGQNNKTDITSDSIEGILNEEYKVTKTGSVEPESLPDVKTEESLQLVSGSSSVTDPKKYSTSLLKNGIMSFEIVPFFNCSPLSPFQLPLRQIICRCSIVLNDCCDEAVTLERPDIEEIVQIVVNKSIRHIAEQVIEIMPNIPVIDLTDDGDSRETQLLESNTPGESTTTIETKEEFLDILKEQCDKSVTLSEHITLYRSDETLNNSLEIQATSASISAAAVTSTGVVSKEKHLKIEDDSGVDTNESEEDGKITPSRSTLKFATSASEENDKIVSHPNVPNTSMINATESHCLAANAVNTYNSSTHSSTNTSRFSGEFMSPPNRSVLDILPNSQNTDAAIPNVELPALQVIGGTCQQQEDVSIGSCVQDVPRNNIWGNEGRSPPPAYPGTMPRDVHTSHNSSVQHSTTTNAQNNTMDTYKKDFNSLGTLLLEYLLFFKNMRNAQAAYIYSMKKMCTLQPMLLSNELSRFQDYYRDNMTYLRRSLKMDVKKLHLSSTMRAIDVPNFLTAVEVCVFQNSSVTSRMSIVLWLHTLMSGDEDYLFWNTYLGCLYRYLETAVIKLRFRNQSGLPFNTDVFSIQQRILLKKQIEEYNTICAKSHLCAIQNRNVNKTIDLNVNESPLVSDKARKSRTNSTNDAFQKIRLPLTVPYDVCVSTSTLSATTSVVSSKTTPTIQQTLLNQSAGANSAALPAIRNYPSRPMNIATPPRIDSSPVHTSSSLNHLVRMAQEQLTSLLNTSKNNNDMSVRNAAPIYTLSIAGSLAQQSNPVYNSQAPSASILNSTLPTATLKSPTRITSAHKTPVRGTSSLKSPAHISAALNTPAYVTSPAHNSVELSDNSHIFKPPQAQLKFKCPPNRVQQTSSVSMSPAQYFGGQPSTSTQPPLGSTNSTVEGESLMLRNLLDSNRIYSGHSSNSENPSMTKDVVEKSPVYAPMLFSPSSYQTEEVDRGSNIETIDLTWVDDVDADHLQMEIEYFVKKEEPVEENHVVLNQEQFPVTPSPTDSGIESPPVQGEINELYTNRTCICDRRAEYICGCRQAMYCSLPCQKLDWASHKAICLKYNAKNKETNSGEQQ